MKAFILIFLLLFSFEASSCACYDDEEEKFSKNLHSFGLIHGFVEEIKNILSRPGAKEDFYKIREIAENDQGKNWFECQFDHYFFGYDPEEAKSDAEKMANLLEYQKRQNPEKREKLTRAKELWLDIAMNLEILTGFKVKALGQTSQRAFDIFISDFIQRFLTAKSPEEFIEKSVIPYSIRPIAAVLKLQGEMLRETEEKQGIQSMQSRQYTKMRDAIESYLSKEREESGADLGEATQKDIQKGKKDGTVTETFNSDKAFNSQDDDELLFDYSPEEKEIVKNYAKKEGKSVRQVIDELTKEGEKNE